MEGCARPHVLVTGASSGIGRATALLLAASGHHVYAGVRKPDDGAALQRDAGGEITPLMKLAPAAQAEHEGMSVPTSRLWLQTRRLTLRPLCDEDLDELCLLLGDAEALALWGGPLDRDGARQWIERNATRYQVDGFGRCAIVLRATGELVGDCGLAPTMVEGIPEIELGWIVRRAHWGKGIATEAAEAWRDHAFTELGLDRIISMISEQNVASRRVAQKLGMTIERAAIWDGMPMLMYACVSPDASRTIQSKAQNREADL